MGARGPKPLGKRRRTLGLPPAHFELYELKAKQANLDWNAYVTWALAQFHGLDVEVEPEAGDQLALDGRPEIGIAS